MLKEMLDNVRKTSPLIQNITNYVTANDCANITLAWGGSPIMSDHEEEAEVGFIKFGNAFNIRLSFLARRKHALIDNIELCITSIWEH